MTRPLDIRHITVRNGALDIEVAVSLSMLRVDSRAAERILSVLPNLHRHVCVAQGHMDFGEEIIGTETAHLFEHVIIELQGQACGGDFTGHTSWLAELADTRSEQIALMRTTVTFQDDLVGLRAVEMARCLVEWALGPDTDRPPDITKIVAQLSAIM